MELTKTLALFVNNKIKQFTCIWVMIKGIKTSPHGLDVVGYRRATCS